MASIQCGKCELTHSSVAEVRRCFGALPTATVVPSSTHDPETGEPVMEVPKRGENFFLTETAAGLYDQAQRDIEYNERVPQVHRFPPALRRGERTDLKVRFEEKDEAKRFGARWDPKNKVWYYEGSEIPRGLCKFLPHTHPLFGDVVPGKSMTSDLIAGRNPYDPAMDSSAMAGASQSSSTLLDYRDQDQLSTHMETSTGTTPTSEAQRTFATKEGVEDGFYKHNGVIYKVQHNLAGTGTYAKKFMLDLTLWAEMKSELELARAEDDEAKIKLLGRRKVGEWEYVPGMYGNLVATEKLTVEEAKEWGALYGVCCRCGRMLTNEDSIDAGIGPVCAGKI